MASVKTKLPPLTDVDVVKRIEIGRKFVRNFARQDLKWSKLHRDPSLLDYLPSDLDSDQELKEFLEDEGEDLAESLPVGISNILTVNIYTKTSAIAMADPDFHIRLKHDGDPEANEHTRLFLRDKWRRYNLVRTSQEWLLKRFVSGLGILTWRWDQDRRCTEWDVVHSWDWALDPATTNFGRIRWAARRIRMTLGQAIERYGRSKFEHLDNGNPGTRDSHKISIWLYFDKEREWHVFGNTVVEKGKNLYGTAVPFLFLLGEADPGKRIWPLGDPALVAGLQAQVTQTQNIINHKALHSGTLNFANAEQLGKAGQDALEKGILSAFIPCRDPNNPPVNRVAGEPLEAALLESLRNSRIGLDEGQAVGEYERGVLSYSSANKTATESNNLANMSGARSLQNRKDFERMVVRMAEVMVGMEILFGGPEYGEDGYDDISTDEERLLWEHLQDISEITVLEGSTQFKDPSQTFQQTLQFLQLLGNLTPFFQQAGMRIPNLERIADDMHRLNGKYDVEDYWLPNPMAGQPGPPGQLGQPGPQGAPGMPMQGAGQMAQGVQGAMMGGLPHPQ